MRLVPPATAALLTLTLAAYLLAPPQSTAFEALALHQAQPQDLWRYLTAHWLHVDASHLLWNLVALALLASLIERADGRSAPLLRDVGVGVTGVVVWFWLPVHEFERYVGLSGMLNTLLVTCVVLYRSRLGNAVTALMLAAALGRSLWQLSTGDRALTMDGSTGGGWSSAAGAHVAGWVAGFVAVAARDLLSRNQPGQPPESRTGSKNAN